MNLLIDHAARAVCLRTCTHDVCRSTDRCWKLFYNHDADEMRENVRAVIAAIRGPTPEMVGKFPYDPGNWMNWQAMIDELLK